MRPGSALVDVAIDQGGCFETSHATTHDDPVFEVDGIVHYCVANMPGAVPVTSTKALTNVTLPYVEAIADKGLSRAIADDPALAKGVNALAGKLTYGRSPRRTACRTRRSRTSSGRWSEPAAGSCGWPSPSACARCSFALSDGETLTTAHVTDIESPRIPAMYTMSSSRLMTVSIGGLG